MTEHVNIQQTNTPTLLREAKRERTAKQGSSKHEAHIVGRTAAGYFSLVPLSWRSIEQRSLQVVRSGDVQYQHHTTDAAPLDVG